MDTKLKFEITAPNFFSIPLRKVEIESFPETGRTYFIHENLIVAVAKRGECEAGPALPNPWLGGAR